MTQDSFPITPPPDLVEQWECEYHHMTFCSVVPDMSMFLTEKAARWGADMELDACCEWVGAISGKYGPRLRLARRPNPPSLKEQALDSWDRLRNEAWCEEIDFDLDFIRCALESLPD